MVINIRIITDENTAFNNLGMNKQIAYVLERLVEKLEGTDEVEPGFVNLLEDAYGDRCGFISVER